MTVSINQRPHRISGGEEAGRFLTILDAREEVGWGIVVCSGLSGGGDRTEFRLVVAIPGEEVGIAAVPMDHAHRGGWLWWSD